MRTVFGAVLLGCGMLAAAPAVFADDDDRRGRSERCPPGLERQGRCFDGESDWRFESRALRDQDRERDRIDDAYRAGYEEGSRDGFRAGMRAPDNVAVLRNYQAYGLPAPQQGYYYGQVDDEVLLIQAATQIITQAFAGY